MNIRNEKGITLLALAITVIVMSILATVAVSASIGDNGLIEQTRAGTIRASIREVEEALDAYVLLREKENIQAGILGGKTKLLIINDTSVLEEKKGTPTQSCIVQIEDETGTITSRTVNQFDLNGDGMVNNWDVILIESYYENKQSTSYLNITIDDTSWSECEKYDVNGNGVIDDEDINYYTNKLSSAEAYINDTFLDFDGNGEFNQDDINKLKEQYYEYKITSDGLNEMKIEGKYGAGTTNDVFYVKQYATDEIEVYYIDNKGVTHYSN